MTQLLTEVAVNLMGDVECSGFQLWKGVARKESVYEAPKMEGV